MFELAEWVLRQRARREIERRPVRTDLVRLLLRWSEIRRGIARGETDPTPHMGGLSRFPWFLPLYQSAQRIRLPEGVTLAPLTPAWNDAIDRWRRPHRARLLAVLIARKEQQSMQGDRLWVGMWCPATHEECTDRRCVGSECARLSDRAEATGGSHWRTQGAPLVSWPTDCACWFCWHNRGQVVPAISGLVYSQRYACAGHLRELEARAAGHAVANDLFAEA